VTTIGKSQKNIFYYKGYSILNYTNVGVSVISYFFGFISYLTKNTVVSKKMNSGEVLNYNLYRL